MTDDKQIWRTYANRYWNGKFCAHVFRAAPDYQPDLIAIRKSDGWRVALNHSDIDSLLTFERDEWAFWNINEFICECKIKELKHEALK